MTIGKHFGTKERAQKVTVSLPADLVEFADEYAEQTGASRSQTVAEGLRALRRAERDRLMAEGYRFYANVDVEIAEAGLPAAREVLPRD